MLLHSNGGAVMSIFINDREFSFKEGESILEVARKNNIYIPTLCHLPKLAPVGACRMCIVEEESGNIIASCKSPATHDAKIYTHTPKLEQHRQEIMKLLCINHPLECGVCDKSGECELQDKVLETKIPMQTFGAVQRKDDFISFKNKIYDESLCIMCERCARTCNQIVGNNYLQVVMGGYNSKIGINSQNYCEDCDECVSVCPTGAMISERFQYNSNAWELEKTSSTCTNCALGCYIIYEGKNTNNPTHISKNKKIYRSTTAMEFSQLCHSGRHNFGNSPIYNKDISKLETAIKAFKNASAIRIGTQISNEEAFIINELKNKLDIPLYCEEARVYSEFISIVKSTSSKPIHITKEILKETDLCISLASFIFDEMPVLKSQIINSITTQKTKHICLHPIPDERLKKHSYIQYEVQTEIGVVALMLSSFTKNTIKDPKINDFIEKLDIGYLSSESNISEEELDILSESFRIAQNPVIFIGSELFYHPQSKQIAYMIGLIEKYTHAKIIIIPPSGNSVGISLICNLSKDNLENHNVVGYKTKGSFILNEMIEDIEYKENADFVLNTDFIIPSMLQIEGTMVNTDYRLLPITPSLPYEGYDICDIAQDFGMSESSLVEITSKLPAQKGFKNIHYDDLKNFFDRNGNEQRGYFLSAQVFSCIENIELPDIDFLPESNGSILYLPKKSGNFFGFNEAKIMASKQFAIANKITDAKKISFNIEGKEFICDFVEEEYLKGMVAIFYPGKYFICNQTYPYIKITLKKWSENA
ncbi:2Fe-2S iron-sulfur cluster-binding protein [Helicobacter cappadocius]|uniref:2Fe-2S iron-sulfur cluster-binding protein n=1 Tax=Helicobacter cappadocius TaxID=3063998 RepID=A0AA90T5M3_9HELI|nr:MULTISPECIES: 2Fe-2S iron-sulfur cluster-binding protein [unclassified Helicobacter]MDO7253709.1 2Fe-2S iron-sulfur cluster-binding protein [Helicobacter sp. faydin-H75]MDP2539603.1 2Fe-2S iron-sulfur cluster-binding protein [Helicobacter sp. faydin-H76]